MSTPDVAGTLLVASFAVFAVGAAPPSLVPVWRAPAPEKPALIAARRQTWLAANALMFAATILLVLGLDALTEPLLASGGGVLTTMSFITMLLGAALWLASLVFRLTTMARTAEPAPGYEHASAWAGGLFIAWTVLANVANTGFGAAVVRADYPSAWIGWAAIAISALILVQLVVTRDGIPALYHVAPAIIGIGVLLD